MSAKILVVDDVAMNVKLLADLLAAKGYLICTAASGAEALARLEAERPDLVLLDVMMPGMSGYDVCRAIRADPGAVDAAGGAGHRAGSGRRARQGPGRRRRRLPQQAGEPGRAARPGALAAAHQDAL